MIWSEITLDFDKMTGHIASVARHSLRENIIDAAVDTFHRKGFNGASVQDIAEVAHAPKGSFYNHFDSKEALAIAALERYWERIRSSFAVLGEPQYPPHERLKRYFGLLTSAARTAEFRKGCLIGNISAEMAGENPALRARLATLLGAWTAGIEACVKEAQADGSVRRDLDPASIAAFLLNSWEGAVMRAKVDRDESALKSFQRVAETVFSA